MEMEPCLLCDVNSVPLASGEAPICGSHRQQAHAAFEAAEPILRTHLEQAYGAELDEWVRQGVLHGLTWHLEVRDHPPAPTRAVPWPQPGRLVQFANDRDGVVRLVRERVLKAFEEEVIPHYPIGRFASERRRGTLLVLRPRRCAKRWSAWSPSW